MENPFGLKAHHVSARVRDLERTIAWYRDVLGLRLIERGEMLNGAMKFARLALPDYEISFVQLDSPAADGKPGMDLVPTWAHPVFSVPDTDALYRHLEARGVRVATYGPKPTPVQAFLFYDSEGNEIEIVPQA